MNEAVALGLGNNIDYEIKWDSRVIESLIENYGVSTRTIRPVEQINTEQDLLISILYNMKNGTGTERYVESLQVIEQFARKFDMDVTLGGTAPRAALAMSKIGVVSSLHLVTINDHVRKLMPGGGSWYCSNSVDTLYPHLIVQYERGAHVAARDVDIFAPVSTRLIYVNDPDNKVMKLEPGFFENARNAHACLISGFNAMRDDGVLQQRLRELAELLEALPQAVTIFYEDACFHNADFRRVVLAHLSSLLDMFSLNEEEMQGYLREKIDLLDPLGMLEAVRALRAIIRVPVLVIHTRYWALASGPDCGRYFAALKNGISIAATRFRLGDTFSKSDVLSTRDFPPQITGELFAREINRLSEGQVCCLPCAEVEEKKVTTIGLGDAFVGGFLSTLTNAGI
jgi:ADP-dependent phosphofructokinase/glucokinase